MRHRLGLRAVLTDLMDGLEIKGDEPTFVALADFSKRNAPHIKGILNLTIPVDESPVWILSQYLGQMALTTQSRRPTENGQRVRYYRLDPDDVAFARQVLVYRQAQRAQRERRRQEEQALQAAYAARMQTMYGVNTPSTPRIIEDGSNNWEGMDGQENSTDSWWQQVKYYAAAVMERVKDGVEAVKKFLSTLTPDERWGVMLAFDELEPVMFGRLVAAAPDWVEWMA